MSIEIPKLKSRVAAFSNSLDELESILEPLFSQTLAETVVNLEPLQQAKLQTDVPYVIYDLVFMYLKLKGIDPKSHAVIGELDRIRQYFDKISHTENPPQRKAEIDKAAAGRFIKAAISSSNFQKPGPEQNIPAASSSSSVPQVPVKVTSKMAERAAYEGQIRREDEEGEGAEEEEGLQVFDEDEDAEGQMDVDAEHTTVPRKRQRPAVDHFAGYGEEQTTEDASKPDSSADASTASSIPQPKKKKTFTSSTAGAKKKKGKKKATES